MTDIYIYIIIYYYIYIIIYNILDIRISADASRRTFAKPSREIYQENHGDPLHVQVIIIIIILRIYTIARA